MCSEMTEAVSSCKLIGQIHSIILSWCFSLSSSFAHWCLVAAFCLSKSFQVMDWGIKSAWQVCCQMQIGVTNCFSGAVCPYLFWMVAQNPKPLVKHVMYLVCSSLMWLARNLFCSLYFLWHFSTSSLILELVSFGALKKLKQLLTRCRMKKIRISCKSI